MLLMGLFAGPLAAGHVQILLPDENIGKDEQRDTLVFDIRFTSHVSKPGDVMNMATPRQFGVVANGEKTSLLSSLTTRRRRPFFGSGQSTCASKSTRAAWSRTLDWASSSVDWKTSLFPVSTDTPEMDATTPASATRWRLRQGQNT